MYESGHPLSIISERPETQELSAYPMSQRGSVRFNSMNTPNAPISNFNNPGVRRFNSGKVNPSLPFDSLSNPIMHSEIISNKKPSFNTLFDNNGVQNSDNGQNHNKKRKKSCEIPTNENISLEGQDYPLKQIFPKEKQGEELSNIEIQNKAKCRCSLM